MIWSWPPVWVIVKAHDEGMPRGLQKQTFQFRRHAGACACMGVHRLSGFSCRRPGKGFNLQETELAHLEACEELQERQPSILFLQTTETLSELLVFGLD